MTQEINIFANQPFSVTPDLNQVVSEDEESICREEVNFTEPNLNIRGSLKFKEIKPYLGDAATPITYPAGPALPFAVEVMLYELSQQQIDDIVFALIYGQKNYKSIGLPDNVEMKHKGSSDLYIWRYEDRHTHKQVQLLFPREALSKIRFALTI